MTRPVAKKIDEVIMTLTAPGGRSFSRDIIRPPRNPPIAPANADDKPNNEECKRVTVFVYFKVICWFIVLYMISLNQNIISGDNEK